MCSCWETYSISLPKKYVDLAEKLTKGNSLVRKLKRPPVANVSTAVLFFHLSFSASPLTILLKTHVSAL